MKKHFSHNFGDITFTHGNAISIATYTEITTHKTARITWKELSLEEAVEDIKGSHFAPTNAKTFDATFASLLITQLDCVATSIWPIKKRAT